MGDVAQDRALPPGSCFDCRVVAFYVLTTRVCMIRRFVQRYPFHPFDGPRAIRLLLTQG